MLSVPSLTSISAPRAELAGIVLWTAPLLDSLDTGGLASLSAGIRLIDVPMLERVPEGRVAP